MSLRVLDSGRAALAIAAVVTALALPVPSFAQNVPAAAPQAAPAKPDRSLPSGREVVDRFVKAIGGR